MMKPPAPPLQGSHTDQIDCMWQTVFKLIEADNASSFLALLERHPTILNLTYEQAIQAGVTKKGHFTFAQTITPMHYIHQREAYSILIALLKGDREYVLASCKDLPHAINLYFALSIICREPALVQDLLTHGANVATIYRGEHVLNTAVRCRNLAIFNLLLKYGAHNVAVQKQNNGKDKAVHLAAMYNNVAMLESLHAQGVDLDVAGPRGTALNLAAAMLNVEAVTYLLAQKVNVAPEGDERMLPLHLAVGVTTHNNLERGMSVISALVAAGAPADAQVTGGLRPIECATTLPVARFFLARGISFISFELFIGLSLNELTSLLSDYVLSSLLPPTEQYFALSYFIIEKKDDHIRLCIDKGILETCQETRNCEVIKYGTYKKLASDHFANIIDSYGILETCMKFNRNLDLVKYLLNHGVTTSYPIALQDIQDSFPRYWYAYVGNSHANGLFTSHYEDNCPYLYREEDEIPWRRQPRKTEKFSFFDRMAILGQVEIVESIIVGHMQKSAQRQQYLDHALSFAIRFEQLEVVKLLYQYGADPWPNVNHKMNYLSADFLKEGSPITRYLYENELNKIRRLLQTRPEAHRIQLIRADTLHAALSGPYKEYLLLACQLPFPRSAVDEKLVFLTSQMHFLNILQPVTSSILLQRYRSQFAQATTEAEFEQLLLVLEVIRTYTGNTLEVTASDLWAEVMKYWPFQQQHAMHDPINFKKLLQRLFSIPVMLADLHNTKSALLPEIVTILNQERAVAVELEHAHDQEQYKLEQSATYFSDQAQKSTVAKMQMQHHDLVAVLLAQLDELTLEWEKASQSKENNVVSQLKNISALVVPNDSKNMKKGTVVKSNEDALILRLLQTKDSQGKTCLQGALARLDIWLLQKLFLLGRPYAAELPQLEILFWQLVDRYNEQAEQFSADCKKIVLALTPAMIAPLTTILTQRQTSNSFGPVIILLAHLLREPAWAQDFMRSLRMMNQIGPHGHALEEKFSLFNILFATAKENFDHTCALGHTLIRALQPLDKLFLFNQTCQQLIQTFQLLSSLVYLLPLQQRALPTVTLRNIAIEGRFELLTLFINARIDLSTVKIADQHPILSYLVMVDDVEFVTLLLSHVSKVERQRLLASTSDENAWMIAWLKFDSPQRTLMLCTLIKYGADLTCKSKKDAQCSYLDIILSNPKQYPRLINAIFTYQPKLITASVIARLFVLQDLFHIMVAQDLLAVMLAGAGSSEEAIFLRKSRLIACFAETVYEKEAAVSYLVRLAFVAFKANDRVKQRELIRLLTMVLNCGSHAQSEQTLAWLSHYYPKATVNEKQFCLELVDLFLSSGVSPLVAVAPPGFVLFPFVKSHPQQCLLVQALELNDFVLLEHFLQNRAYVNSVSNGEDVRSVTAIYTKGCYLLLAKEMDAQTQFHFFNLFLSRGINIDAHLLEIVTGQKTVNLQVLVALLDQNAPRSQHALTHAKRIFAQIQTVVKQSYYDEHRNQVNHAHHAGDSVPFVATLINNESLRSYFTEASPAVGLSYKQLQHGEHDVRAAVAVAQVPKG